MQWHVNTHPYRFKNLNNTVEIVALWQFTAVPKPVSKVGLSWRFIRIFIDSLLEVVPGRSTKERLSQREGCWKPLGVSLSQSYMLAQNQTSKNAAFWAVLTDLLKSQDRQIFLLVLPWYKNVTFHLHPKQIRRYQRNLTPSPLFYKMWLSTI